MANRQSPPKQEQRAEEDSSVDFIIVGGGTAGCVLANRLSAQLPSLSILVLEAGEDRRRDERIYTPGLARKLLGNDDFDWQYETVPEPGLNNRVIEHPRGKVLGGSSAINSFALIYPNRAGIDVWAKLGNEGWGWDGFERYLRRFQTICPPSKALLEGEHVFPVVSSPGGEGPIQASLPTREPRNVLHKAWVETWRALGLENNKDPIEGEAIGGYISTCHVTADTRERSHAGVGFLDDQTLKRENLSVLTGATVERIECEKGEGAVVATGVRYTKDGDKKFVRARKEVLLAAGAFASPQILELSGIGDPEILAKYGIDVVVANQNVGENLQDHIRAGVSFESTPAASPGEALSDEAARKLYEEKREGPWAENCCWMFAEAPLVPFLDEGEKADLERLLSKHLDGDGVSEFERVRNEYIRHMTLSPTEAVTTSFLTRRAAIDHYGLPTPTPDAQSAPHQQPTRWVSLLAMLSHPFSRGNVHITSSDVREKPAIDFRYYSHPLDLEIHALYLRKAFTRLSQTSPLSHHLVPGGKFLPPNTSLATTEGAKRVCQEFARTNYHPCGSCSMLPEALGGVVDEGLRVYGVRNLRVVDASVMPIIPRGNTVVGVYGVAEKGSDIVVQKWKGREGKEEEEEEE